MSLGSPAHKAYSAMMVARWHRIEDKVRAVECLVGLMDSKEPYDLRRRLAPAKRDEMDRRVQQYYHLAHSWYTRRWVAYYDTVLAQPGEEEDACDSMLVARTE